MTIMNKLVHLAGAGALFLSSTSASAASAWESGQVVNAHGAVAVKSTIYYLSNTWLPQGWRVQQFDHQAPGNPSVIGNTGATSITVSSEGSDLGRRRGWHRFAT